MGDRPLCVARELTKIYEEFVRGTVAEVSAHYTAQPPRGEVVIVIGGAIEDDAVWDEARVQARLVTLLDDGESLSRAAKAVAAYRLEPA